MNNHSPTLRTAIDHYFVDLNERPSVQYKVLAAIHSGVKVKKKLSVGLVLAIVLVLLAAGAAAAVLLSMRQIVEEEAVPMANKYEGEAYTAEDTNLLVELAEENGIELSRQTKDQIQRALDQGEGYFKEEMLMAMAKAEFGENPAAWTLEEQKWFDDVCVAIGFIDEPEKAMPETGEAAKEPIIRAAVDYIHATYVADLPLSDPAKYETCTQYVNGGPDDEYTGLFWSVTFSPKYLEGGEYWVYLRDDGTVLDDWVRPGIAADSTVSDIQDSYRRVYGSDLDWDQSTLRAFKASAALASDTNNQAYLCLLQTTYPDIPEGAITREQAYDVAAASLGVETPMGTTRFCFIGDDPNPVWKFTVTRGDENWSVEVDCATQEIKTMRLLDNLHRRWWMSTVLWKVSDEVEEHWVDDSPPAVG